MCTERPTMAEFAPDARGLPQKLSRKELMKAKATLAVVKSVARERVHLLAGGATYPNGDIRPGASQSDVDSYLMGMRRKPPKLKSPDAARHAARARRRAGTPKKKG